MKDFFKGIIRLIQGSANNLVWFANISLAAAIAGAIGISAYYAKSELGKAFIDDIYENEHGKEDTSEGI